MDDGRPIFLQIAELLENSIVDGSLAEETQVPSTNELAAFHRINPATAAKGARYTLQIISSTTVWATQRGTGTVHVSRAKLVLPTVKAS